MVSACPEMDDFLLSNTNWLVKNINPVMLAAISQYLNFKCVEGLDANLDSILAHAESEGFIFSSLLFSLKMDSILFITIFIFRLRRFY